MLCDNKVKHIKTMLVLYLYAFLLRKDQLFMKTVERVDQSFNVWGTGQVRLLSLR